MTEKHRRRRPPRVRRRTPPGATPGSLTVDPNAPRSTVRVIAYGPDQVTEQTIDKPEQLCGLVGRAPVTWVYVEGLGDAAMLSGIARVFDLHPLAMEDVVNTHQRAKVDDYGKYLFLVVRMVGLGERLETEQLAMFLGSNFVVSFEERPPSDCLEPLRERIRRNQGRMRQAGADYLVYSMLDAVIDAYFPVLEEYAERLETLDEQIGNGNGRESIAQIHDMRRDLLLLRRAIWPHREAVNELIRDPYPQVSNETRLYLRDCLDHIVAIVDLTETYREMGSDLREYSLSTVSMRLNEIMKVLTVIATTFMPLSFLASLYGMNFNTESPWNMPELNWRYGYPYALGLMGLVALGMLTFFQRRGWLGMASAPREQEHEDSRGGA